MSLACTPEISSNLFSVWHVYSDLSPQYFNPNNREAARLTRKGKTDIWLQQLPKALLPKSTARSPVSPSFMHQYIRALSAWLLIRDLFWLDLLTSLQPWEVLNLPSASFFLWLVAQDRVLEAQSDSETGEQAAHKESDCGGKQTPDTEFSVKTLHLEQIIFRTCRANRELSWWTDASQLQQRKASSDGQNVEAWAPHSSQNLYKLFIITVEKSTSREGSKSTCNLILEREKKNRSRNAWVRGKEKMVWIRRKNKKQKWEECIWCESEYGDRKEEMDHRKKM